MNVVIVDGDISYPPTSGKRLRTLHLMLRLARRHRITYLCRGPGHGAEARAARTFLGDHGIETIVIDAPVPHKSGPLFYARLAANLWSPLPYSVATHASPEVFRAVRARTAQQRVDLWQFEWTAYADALRDDVAARKVVVAPNVDSLIWERYYAAETQPLRRWYIRQQWRKFERFEGRVFREATRVVAVTEEDARLIRNRFGMPHVDVVDNGIDRAHFAAVRGTRDPHRVLYLGSLDWRPNLDALTVLLDRIFPEVLVQEPAARLDIVGRAPPTWLVERVRGLKHVTLHADVADVRPFLAECGVLAVPLRIGGGSRLKILEALACGLPVVSTRIGAEGLALHPGRDLVVVEEPAEIAPALVQCLRAPAEAARLAEAGRRLVLERYDWDVLADKLDRVWEKCSTATSVAA